jgi:hypothetical protein
MLKIGSVRWRGKCSRHPMFDPYMDGRGAVKAGCTRCEALAEIHDCHQKMLRLMRGFAPPPVIPKKPGTSFDDRQESLFD